MAVLRVSGNLGAGKTTTCNMLAEALGYKNYYTGDIFRQLAREKGLSIEEFYKQMADNPKLEKEIDNRQINLMMTEDNLIVQGRTAPFQPCNSNFKKINIFFKVSSEEGAKRQLQRPENKHLSLKKMLELSQNRTLEERVRFRKLYGIHDYLDESYFDIVIDTTHLNPNQVFNKLLKEINQYLQEEQ